MIEEVEPEPAEETQNREIDNAETTCFAHVTNELVGEIDRTLMEILWRQNLESEEMF